MDQPLNLMLEMHAKMMNATTLEEHSTLMAEHKRTLQEAMAVVAQGGMNSRMPWDMATRQKMLEKRMEMMEALMQKMMERLSAEPVK